MLKKLYRLVILPYTLFMLYTMFWGMGRYQLDDNELRIKPILSTLEYLEEDVYSEKSIFIVLGNLIMFMPYGCISWVFPSVKSLKDTVYYFLSVILVIEVLQYFTRMGVFDIDDVLLNTFGVFLGWLVGRFLELKFKNTHLVV